MTKRELLNQYPGAKYAHIEVDGTDEFGEKCHIDYKGYEFFREEELDNELPPIQNIQWNEFIEEDPEEGTKNLSELRITLVSVKVTKALLLNSLKAERGRTKELENKNQTLSSINKTLLGILRYKFYGKTSIWDKEAPGIVHSSWHLEQLQKKLWEKTNTISDPATRGDFGVVYYTLVSYEPKGQGDALIQAFYEELCGYEHTDKLKYHSAIQNVDKMADMFADWYECLSADTIFELTGYEPADGSPEENEPYGWETQWNDYNIYEQIINMLNSRNVAPFYIDKGYKRCSVALNAYTEASTQYHNLALVEITMNFLGEREIVVLKSQNFKQELLGGEE